MEKYEELLISLRRIIRSIDLHSKKLNKTSGMTGPQLLVLQEVYKERGITAKRIAENVNLSQGTITTILDKLESRDLVNRIRSETDRRRVSLFLTEKGSLLLEKAPKPMQEEFIERFKNLDEWEQNLLLSSFSRVAQMMDASKIDAAPLLEIGTIVDPVKKVDVDKKSDKPA
ncbi:MarR family winged helix-turn-helix transcriptional regulator [Pleionea mediterranea]|uniref:DNA-binding MarR family transcriptional regulator n=1 Tax=Pleionea mediterranea TaxID=523701 RepID=A0A316FEH3_9GAMM|nr:MarR family transcriptional regulator [Pleionea mediterranea]PWK47311.1 DNA-binding MarR family transcriptional regulator [Pleionea mediterranea]